VIRRGGQAIMMTIREQLLAQELLINNFFHSLPLENFYSDCIHNYAPNRQNSNLLSAISYMCTFKSDIAHRIVELFKRQYFTNLLQPARKCFG
jgi:hypothetical protein